ncbi:UNVERIFIED_CONTAM: putative endonuclease [Brevibacillus sp. OAP136]
MRNCTKCIMENEIPLYKGHFVYILLCADGSLYTGYTTEPKRRLRQHEEGKGAKYTRGRGPFQLVYLEEGSDRSWGLCREEAIKRLSREKKEWLIKEGGTRGRASAEKL